MTKKEIVAKMADGAGLSNAVAQKALASALEAIGEALQKGEKVSFTGFGTFSVAQRAAREGRNPQTGKPVKIEARKAVRFKVGRRLADKVNA